VYSQRVIAAAFLMKMNERGILKDRFLFREIKSNRGTLTFASLTTYLGKTAKPFFDLSFEYSKGAPVFPTYSVGAKYASWRVKNVRTNDLVYPDPSEIIEWKPPYDPSKAPQGLKDGERRGHTCRELEERGFFSAVAADFNEFLVQIQNKLDPTKHTLDQESSEILYMNKNTSIPTALFSSWFAYLDSNNGPPNRNPSGWDTKVIDALADFFDRKVNAERISGITTIGGLFKNSDGNECDMPYSGGGGQKRLTDDLITVMNSANNLSQGDIGFVEL